MEPRLAFIMLISRLTGCLSPFGYRNDYGLSKLLALWQLQFHFMCPCVRGQGIKNAKVIISNGNVCDDDGRCVAEF